MVGGDGKPALQVIVLGSGGGPNELNSTAFLIRSIALQWGKGSVLALDAGVHIAAILRIFEQSLARAIFEDKEQHNRSPDQKTALFTIGSVIKDGPLQGFQCRFKTPGANAGHFLREIIDAYLITHPHLDHISATIINSPTIAASMPKIMAGLPSTIDAIKTHLLNGIIWPNMSNEDNGIGLFKYMRLQDGGIPEQGYYSICEGLSIFPRSVSHGHKPCVIGTPKEGHPFHKNESQEADFETVESTAYFVKDDMTDTEILVFGDIEPDSLSLVPRNWIVWQDAAIKIRAGNLKAIFMECSWDNSQPDAQLYGHMTPRFVMEELEVLANLVSSPAKGTKPLSNISNASKRSNKTRKHGGSLEGITVVIIHMKEKFDDGPSIQEVVKSELMTIEENIRLGCTFVISEPGMSLEF